MRDEWYEGYLSPKNEKTVDDMACDGFSRQDSFELYFDILINACQRVNDLYFNVPLVTEIKSPEDFRSVLEYREKVYCYELYHQKRTLLEKRGSHIRGLLLNAETDKAGAIYTTFVGARKPDFVLHRPGDGIHNVATTEVKRISAPINDIEKDMGKLKEFLDPETMNYFGGVALIYGEEEGKIEKIQTLLKKHFGKYWPKRFKALWHRKPGSRPELWSPETGRFSADSTIGYG